MTGLRRTVIAAEEMMESTEWNRCVSVCLDARSIGPEHGRDDWVELRFLLATATTELRLRGAQVDTGRVIECLQEVLDLPELEEADERRGVAHLHLARMYDLRSSEVVRSDTAAAVAHWTKAASIFDPDRHPEAWAASRECAGVGTLEIVRTLLEMQYFTMPGVAKFTEELVEYAIGAFTDAASLYSDEKLANVEALIGSAEEMLTHCGHNGAFERRLAVHERGPRCWIWSLSQSDNCVSVGDNHVTRQSSDEPATAAARQGCLDRRSRFRATRDTRKTAHLITLPA